MANDGDCLTFEDLPLTYSPNPDVRGIINAFELNRTYGWIRFAPADPKGLSIEDRWNHNTNSEIRVLNVKGPRNEDWLSIIPDLAVDTVAVTLRPSTDKLILKGILQSGDPLDEINPTVNQLATFRIRATSPSNLVSRVICSNAGDDFYISSICLSVPDLDKLVESERSSIERSRPEVKEVADVHSEEFGDLLSRSIREAKEAYKSKDEGKKIVIGINSSLIDLGLPPLVIHWPPPWNCVLKNIVATVALSVALASLATTLGIPTIAELAAADAAAVLTKFGVAASNADAVIKMLGAGHVVAQAFLNCEQH